MTAPRVFISYSHDSGEHAGYVLELAQQMRAEGMDVWIDRFSPHPAEGWPEWMDKQLSEAQFVIMILTETYIKRFEGREDPAAGKGVDHEARWIKSEIYHNKGINERFIPVLVSGSGNMEMVPSRLRDYRVYTLPMDYEDLYRRLTDQPAVTARKLGSVRQLDVMSPGCVDAVPDAGSQDLGNSENPYCPNRIARNGDFIGREAELYQLMQDCGNGHSISIVGNARIGKSSLLHSFHERWKKVNPELETAIKLLDGQGRESVNESAFVQAITTRPAAEDPHRAANQLEEWAKAATRNGTLGSAWLMIDEFEGLLTQTRPFSTDFFKRMRSMEESGLLRLVAVSRMDVDELFEQAQATSPIANKLQRTTLGLFGSKEEAERLVKRGGFDGHWNEAMLEWTGWHPFYLNLIGYHLWESRAAGVGLERGIDRFFDAAAPRLRESWRALDARKKNVIVETAGGAAVKSRWLCQRGILRQDGTPFGRILVEWMRDEGLA